MDGRRVAQLVVLLAAIALIVFGVTQFGSRARVASVFVTIGVVVLLIDGVLLYSMRGGSPVGTAPGHGIRLGERHLLHDQVAGVAGATSYELDLYGSEVDAATVGVELGRKLTPLGYRQLPLTKGPVLASNATQAAQYGLRAWLWRVYELPLPTRFAGVNYSVADFPHLVAVTLSDDGSTDAVPSP